jgi:ribonuclease P protein component
VRLTKAARLRRRREFLAVQERGRRVHARELVVVVLGPRVAGGPRLGVTVSSRVGNAVVRNRIKRWVREAFRSLAPELPAYDYVVIARAGAEQAGLEGAKRALAAAAEKLRRPAERTT